MFTQAKATVTMVVVLGLVSLDVGVEDILSVVWATCRGGVGRGRWVVGGFESRWHNKFHEDKGKGFGLSLFDRDWVSVVWCRRQVRWHWHWVGVFGVFGAGSGGCLIVRVFFGFGGRFSGGLRFCGSGISVCVRKGGVVLRSFVQVWSMFSGVVVVLSTVVFCPFVGGTMT